MKRPAFMFYPKDWRNNAKLRRCSAAARGVWMDVLCLLHDSEEDYGAVRWPLKDLAKAAGASMLHVRELVEKRVLKGADTGLVTFDFTPTHAGQRGTPVVLLSSDSGPLWYCSRMVRDEWIRQRRGQASRFDTDHQPAAGPKKAQPKRPPKRPPKTPIGGGSGDGLAVAFAVALNTPIPPTPTVVDNSVVQAKAPPADQAEATQRLLAAMANRGHSLPPAHMRCKRNGLKPAEGMGC